MFSLHYRFETLLLGYEKTAVLSVPSREFQSGSLGIIGHNGAGKSTFIKAILELLPPIAGALNVFHNEEKLIPETHMAYCPETGSVFLDLRVEDYLKLWSQLRYRSSRYYRREGSKYIECLDIRPLMRKFGRELSKGQKRRVQTAIGFMLHPRLFLFDEPFDGLDVSRTAELASILENHREQMAFIISSHRMDIIERACDHVAVLHDGKLLTVGPTSHVIRQLAPHSEVDNLTDAFTLFLAAESLAIE